MVPPSVGGTVKVIVEWSLLCFCPEEKTEMGREKRTTGVHFFFLSAALNFLSLPCDFFQTTIEKYLLLVWICLNEGVGEWEPSLAAF